VEQHCFRLRSAASEGSELTVEQTLDIAHSKQIDGFIDSADKWGYTALIEASMWGHVGVVNFLLERGAIVSKPSLAGETALHWASMNGHLQVVKILLYRGKADPNAVTRRKRTPLHMAAEKGHSEVISMLMKAGCNGNARDDQGKTPLDAAKKAGEEECVVVLSENRTTAEKRIQLKFVEKKIQVSSGCCCCCCVLLVVLYLVLYSFRVCLFSCFFSTILFVLSHPAALTTSTKFPYNNNQVEQLEKTNGLLLQKLRRQQKEIQLLRKETMEKDATIEELESPKSIKSPSSIYNRERQRKPRYFLSRTWGGEEEDDHECSAEERGEERERTDPKMMTRDDAMDEDTGRTEAASHWKGDRSVVDGSNRAPRYAHNRYSPSSVSSRGGRNEKRTTAGKKNTNTNTTTRNQHSWNAHF